MVTGLTDAVLLVALGIGYIVCYLAKREDKLARIAGLAIGLFIILLSFVMILANLNYKAQFIKRNNMMRRPPMAMQQPGVIPPQNRK